MDPDGGLTTRIGDLARAPVLTVEPTASIEEAARAMRDADVGSALVVGQPIAIITDRDLRNRVLAEGRSPRTPVAEVMTAPAVTCPADASVVDGLLLMLRRDIHHLPIVDGGRVVGMVTDDDILRQQASSPFTLLQRLASATDPSACAGFADEVAAVVETLTRGGVDAVRTAEVVSTLTDGLNLAVLRLAEDRLGPPPAPYAWIVHGSEGRREQSLLTDQDNALVHAGTGDPDELAWYASLATSVVEDLARAGIPRCVGGFMATTWCDPIDVWVARFDRWGAEPDGQAVMDAANLFDHRAVHGLLDLIPLEAALARTAGNGIFQARLAAATLRLRPPLRRFGRIREGPEGIDLKEAGLVPIVSVARVLAYAAGSTARGTLRRLADAAHGGTLSADGADALTEAFGFLLELRLSVQLEDVRAGRPPSNRVHLEQLTTLQRRHLKEAFVAIAAVQQSVAQRFDTGRLT